MALSAYAAPFTPVTLSAYAAYSTLAHAAYISSIVMGKTPPPNGRAALILLLAAQSVCKRRGLRRAGRPWGSWAGTAGQLPLSLRAL